MEDGRIYAGAVIGIVYDKGEWFLVGADGGEYDGMVDFSGMYPWCDMEAVSIDGNAVVKVPKFYIKTEVLPDSSQHPGKRAFLVSGDMGPGYRLHPAFLEDGKAKDCFYLGAYEASLDDEGKAVSAYGKTAILENSLQDTYDACPDGWHLQTVYERSAVKGETIDTDCTPSQQYKIETVTVRLNPLLLNAWISAKKYAESVIEEKYPKRPRGNDRK